MVREKQLYETNKLFSALDRPCQIEQLYCNQGQQRERVQGPAVILVFRCDIDETIDERGTDKQGNKDRPQAKHSVKEFARTQVFIAAMQKISRQHERRQREQQGFQKHQKKEHRSRDGLVLEDHLSEAGQTAQQI